MCAKGKTRKEVALEHPELVAMAREWDRIKRNQRYQETKPRSAALTHIEKMSWSEVKEHVNRYWLLTRNGHYDSDELPALREFATYYTRVSRAEREKKKQHPDILPHRLGFDPRTRAWPSGKIEYRLDYHEKPGTIKHRSRKRKRKESTC
jgi:hypothetical protein